MLPNSCQSAAKQQRLWDAPANYIQQQPGTEKRGRQQGGSLFGKASLLYGETVIEYHSVSDIAARTTRCYST